MGFEDRPPGGDRLISHDAQNLTATVLTAADQKFARTLWQYLKSVERARLQGGHSWIVYDLGLSERTLESLQARFSWCSFKPFPFGQWPPHLRMENRNYAWKPVLVAEEVLESDGVVLWFDCATLFKGSIDHAIRTARAHGLWYLRGQTRLYQHADARSLDAMQVPLEVRHLGECVSGAIGFDARHAAARQIAVDWRDYALRQEIIAPPGASLADHKFDQALLSAVIFKAVRDGTLHLSQEEIDISSRRPIRWMSSRNKVAPNIPFCADFAVRAYYANYKWLDRLWLRASHLFGTRLGGFRRHVIEQFIVSVTDHATQQSKALPTPRYGYLADPFIWSTDAGLWVFAEEFSCVRDRGRLVIVTLDADLSCRQKSDIAVVDPCGGFDCHASFPFVFEHLGRFFMIPETSHRRTVDLYECVRWPDRWTLARRLLLGVDAADSVAIRHEGRWWLLTSVSRGSGGRHLEIFSCDDITTDPLEPHPINADRIGMDAPYGTGRNAGRMWHDEDGRLHRFVQQSSDFYGQGGELRRIVQLTRTAFVEEPAVLQKGDGQMEDILHCHHYSRSGGYSATDRRTRASLRDFLLPCRRNRNRHARRAR